MNKLLTGTGSIIMAAIMGSASFSTQAEVNWYADASLAFGGDTMAEVEVETYGGDIEDAKIKAGEGLSFSIGGRADIGGNFDAAVVIGFKFGGVVATEGSATFDRMPMTAQIFYDFGKIQLGLGLLHEINCDLDLSDAGGPNLDIDDADGEIVSLLWDVSDSISIGLRYTMIDYELSDFLNDYNGDHFAFTAGFSF